MMKKSLRNSILLLLTAMLLTVSALADSGPKAQLTVKVVNAPSEPYYLDLLAEGAFEHEDDVDYSGVDWSYHGESVRCSTTGCSRPCARRCPRAGTPAPRRGQTARRCGAT